MRVAAQRSRLLAVTVTYPAPLESEPGSVQVASPEQQQAMARLPGEDRGASGRVEDLPVPLPPHDRMSAAERAEGVIGIRRSVRRPQAALRLGHPADRRHDARGGHSGEDRGIAAGSGGRPADPARPLVVARQARGMEPAGQLDWLRQRRGGIRRDPERGSPQPVRRRRGTLIDRRPGREEARSMSTGEATTTGPSETLANRGSADQPSPGVSFSASATSQVRLPTKRRQRCAVNEA
jgi:hypothetical protein